MHQPFAPMVGKSRAVATAVLLCALLGTSGAALAVPLDADACAKLKLQKDALVAAGVPALASGGPAVGSMAGERLLQVRALIDVDGQLRFRCGMDLPLPNLKPDPVEEFVDTGDTAGAGLPNPRAPKKAKPARATAVPAAAAPTSAPAKAAAIKTGSTTDGAGAAVSPVTPTPKAPAKSRAKVDDAYRAAPAAEVSPQ